MESDERNVMTSHSRDRRFANWVVTTIVAAVGTLVGSLAVFGILVWQGLQDVPRRADLVYSVLSEKPRYLNLPTWSVSLPVKEVWDRDGQPLKAYVFVQVQDAYKQPLDWRVVIVIENAGDRPAEDIVVGFDALPGGSINSIDIPRGAPQCELVADEGGPTSALARCHRLSDGKSMFFWLSVGVPEGTSNRAAAQAKAISASFTDDIALMAEFARRLDCPQATIRVQSDETTAERFPGPLGFESDTQALSSISVGSTDGKARLGGTVSFSDADYSPFPPPETIGFDVIPEGAVRETLPLNDSPTVWLVGDVRRSSFHIFSDEGIDAFTIELRIPLDERAAEGCMPPLPSR